MRHTSCIGTALSVLLVLASQAMGGRCLDVPETQILWCDDFDNYCEGGATWTGYPPFPDICATDGSAVADDDAFFSNWLLPFNCLDSGYLENQGITAELSPGTVTPPPRQLAYNLPFTMKFAGAGYTGGPNPNWLVPTRHVFPLTAAIQAQDPLKDGVNGTDANSLKLKYFLNHYKASDCTYCGGDAGNAIWYTELTLEDDRAPTDYINKNCLYDPVSPDFKAIYPIICQQRLAVDGCPPLSTTVHASIAVGLMALLDVQPCDVENGRRPTNYHLSVFDGLTWRDLRSNHFPGNGGDFGVGTDGEAWAYVEIKTGSFSVTWDSTAAGIPAHSEATITRQYTGPFNKIASGPGPGCELSSSTYTCVSGYDCWKYCSGSDLNANESVKKPNWCWRNTYWDSPVLYDGVLVLQGIGACCEEDGTCTPDIPASNCLGYGQRWHIGTTCDDAHCCPYPFADADKDRDVDQMDFGAFQLCYTGSPGGVPAGCECFNRDADSNIDADDFTEFNKCWTGPNVHYADVVQPPEPNNCIP